MIIDEPIRILHVLTGMNMAGAETLLMNIYRSIDRTKIQFDFAVSTPDKCDYDDEILLLGGKIIHYPRYRIYNHFQYVNWWKDFFEKHDEYRIVHGHIGSTAAIYLSIAKKQGIYTIAHSHNTKSKLSLRSMAYSLYSFPTRYIADFFMGCSRQALIDRYGHRVAESDSSFVLKNAIFPEKYQYNVQTREKVRDKFDVKPDTLFLGTVGRLTTQKNPYEIIKICKILKDNGINFKFLWVGTGELEKDINKMIVNNKLTDYFIMCGARNDVDELLQGLDLFLFPSIWEGLGIACIEAQAAGLPTLCSNVLPAEAKVSELCTFLPLNETDIWCSTIMNYNELIHDQDYVRPNTIKQIIASGFSMEAVAKSLEDFYLENYFNR